MQCLFNIHLMGYANQNPNGLVSIGDEDPDLLFTETDRRLARADLTNGTNQHVERLNKLQLAGSHQANYFLGRILGLPEPDVHADGIVINYDLIVKEMWTAQHDGDELRTMTAALSLGLNPECLTGDGR